VTRRGTFPGCPCACWMSGSGVTARSDLDVERGRDRVGLGVGTITGRVHHDGVGVGHRVQEQDLPGGAAEVPRAERAQAQAAAGRVVAYRERGRRDCQRGRPAAAAEMSTKAMRRIVSPFSVSLTEQVSVTQETSDPTLPAWESAGGLGWSAFT
jgi:hypothetical protein